MRIVKYKKIILTALFISLVAGIGGLMSRHTVLAAADPPNTICYSGLGENSGQRVQCDSIAAENLSDLEAGKCYISRFDAANNKAFYADTDCENIQNDTGAGPGGASTNGTGADANCIAKPKNDPCHNVIIEKYVQPLINFLAIGFGLITTIMVVVGGIQYTTAGSDPQKVAAAKSRIANAIFSLVIFAFMYALLQWLIPGGIF